MTHLSQGKNHLSRASEYCIYYTLLVFIVFHSLAQVFQEQNRMSFSTECKAKGLVAATSLPGVHVSILLLWWL